MTYRIVWHCDLCGLTETVTPAHPGYSPAPLPPEPWVCPPAGSWLPEMPWMASFHTAACFRRWLLQTGGAADKAVSR